jgi:hypothetical protein
MDNMSYAEEQDPKKKVGSKINKLSHRHRNEAKKYHTIRKERASMMA